MSWTEVIDTDKLPVGERQVVKLGDKNILLLNHEGKIYAVDNICPHLKLPMKKGKITSDCAIVCPWHRSSFDLETGAVKQWSPFPPVVGKVMGMMSKEKSLAVFPTRVEAGKIMVDL